MLLILYKNKNNKIKTDIKEILNINGRRI
jgi:hypothetical protein